MHAAGRTIPVATRSCLTRSSAARSLLLTTCLLLLVSPSLPAQGIVDGTVAGSVATTSGGPIRDAIVRLRALDTGLDASVTTGRHGEYLAPHLPPGSYRIQITARGFRALSVPDIAVTPMDTTAVDSILISTGFLAGALPPQPALPSAPVPDPIPESLPPSQLIALESATAVADIDEEGQAVPSFNGLAPTQNSSRLDGVSNDQSFSATPRGAGSDPGEEPDDEDAGSPSVTGRGTSTSNGRPGRYTGAGHIFSQGATREFRTRAHSYTALSSRGGGALSTLSRNGTNDLHGSAFYNLRESAWAATNPFSTATRFRNGAATTTLVKPHDLRQQFGGTIAGAVRRNRVFYLYAVEAQRRDFPAVSSPLDPNFYSLTPTQLGLLATRGVRTASVNAALTYLDSLTGAVPRSSTQTINFGRLDWQATPRVHLTGEYNRARWNSPGGATSSPVISRGTASLGSSTGSVDAAILRLTANLTRNLSNESRFQYAHELQSQLAQPPLPQEPAIGPGGFAPEVSIGPQGMLFGTPAALGRKAYPDERRFQIADDVALIHGRNLLQAGLDISFVHDFINALNNQEGTFNYDSGLTNGHAGGLVDWITDATFGVNSYPNGACPSINAAIHYFCFRSFTQSFGPQTVDLSTQEWSAFVENSWRARPGLTVNAGLRYEYEFLPLPQRPNPLLDAQFGSVGATSIFPEDRNNLGPRVGVAWHPAGLLTIHAGYGIYFGRLPGATLRSLLLNTALPASNTHIRIVPTTGTNCPQVANQGFGYPCAYITTPPAAVVATTTASVFDSHFRLPTIQQGSISLERELPRSTSLTLTYLFNLDRQLPSSVDVNIAPSTVSRSFQIEGGPNLPGLRHGENFTVPLYTARLSQAFGPVTDVLSNVNASYHAGILEARARPIANLSLRVSFAWSKAIDYAQTGGAVPRTNNQFDPFTNGYDKALSSLNISHHLIATALYAPRISTAQHWLQSTANGWTIAPIFTERSGRPYSYDIFGGTRLSGGHESINGAGGAVYLPTIGRNTLRLPDAFNADLRLTRSFTVFPHRSERTHLRFFAEAFNLTNRVNYSGLNQRAFLLGVSSGAITPLNFQDAQTIAGEGLNTSPFGTFTSSGTSQAGERHLQLGLHLDF